MIYKRPVEEAILAALSLYSERARSVSPNAPELDLYPTAQDLLRLITTQNISYQTYPAISGIDLQTLRARLSEMRADRSKPSKRRRSPPVIKGLGKRKEMTVYRPLTPEEYKAQFTTTESLPGDEPTQEERIAAQEDFETEKTEDVDNYLAEKEDIIDGQ